MPPSGQPIIHLANHPTTGGYPVSASYGRITSEASRNLRLGELSTCAPSAIRCAGDSANKEGAEIETIDPQMCHDTATTTEGYPPDDRRHRTAVTLSSCRTVRQQRHGDAVPSGSNLMGLLQVWSTPLLRDVIPRRGCLRAEDVRVAVQA